jgi:hypothetical protein
MPWSLAADAVLTLHLCFVVFAIGAGFLTWRWPWVAWLHIPALLWGAWVELSSQICPLTPLENHLRVLAGEAGYSGGFLQHYLVPVLYPLGLTRHIQWALGAILVSINAIAYGRLMQRRHAGGKAA